MQWSLEQIAARLKLKVRFDVSYKTIYAGMFDTLKQKRSTGNRGAIRNFYIKASRIEKKATCQTEVKSCSEANVLRQV